MGCAGVDIIGCFTTSNKELIKLIPTNNFKNILNFCNHLRRDVSVQKSNKLNVTR